MSRGRDLRALTFDVFGTVVDWRTGVAREAEALIGATGHTADWGAFADRWRALYQPAMQRVRLGERPWTILDDLHRENLVSLLGEMAVVGLSAKEQTAAKDLTDPRWVDHKMGPKPTKKSVTKRPARLAVMK